MSPLARVANYQVGKLGRSSSAISFEGGAAHATEDAMRQGTSIALDAQVQNARCRTGESQSGCVLVHTQVHSS